MGSFAFANITEKNLVLRNGGALVLDALGTVFTSMAPIKVKDLSRLQYLVGAVRYELELSAADSSAVLVLRVKNGANVIGQTTITADGATLYGGEVSVNLSGVQGDDSLTFEAEVTTAGAAALKGNLGAALEIVHPLIIGS